MDAVSGTGSGLSRRTLLAGAVGVGVTALAGCSGGDDGYVITAEVADDPEDVERDWQPVAEWIEGKTGVETDIDAVGDASSAIGALATGQTDAAYLSGGPSWVGWNEHGFETLAVEADDDGKTHYVAAAYTRSDTGIETMRDAEGVDSAHTGDLTGAGMLIPVASLVEDGLVSFDSTDDVTAIRDAVEEYFGNPIIGGGYIGALQALSEGQADIAFGRVDTPETYCGGDSAEPWCLDSEEYEIVREFTEVPSHPVLASTDTTEDERDQLEDALLALNGDAEGQEILEDVFGISQLEPATAESHLGPYGELISNLPGIEDHLLE